MASARRKISSASLQFSFEFPELPSNSVKCSVVLGIIKQVLYQRDQIPLPFPQLKLITISFDKHPTSNANHLDLPNGETEPTSEGHTQEANKNSMKGRLLQSSYDRKLTSTVEHLELVFKIISSYINEISSLLLLLGPTPVSPKETYIINFPRTCTECSVANGNCLRASMTKLLKLFLADNNLQKIPDIQPTNINIMLQMLRHISLNKNIEPKNNFSMPKRGQIVTFNLHTKDNCRHTLTENGSSGFEMVVEDCTSELKGICIDSKDKKCGFQCQDDYTWFQVTPTVKGLKKSSSNVQASSSSDGIFL